MVYTTKVFRSLIPDDGRLVLLDGRISPVIIVNYTRIDHNRPPPPHRVDHGLHRDKVIQENCEGCDQVVLNYKYKHVEDDSGDDPLDMNKEDKHTFREINVYQNLKDGTRVITEDSIQAGSDQQRNTRKKDKTLSLSNAGISNLTRR